MVDIDFLNDELFSEEQEIKVSVVGVGGAGNNVLNHMIELGIENVNYIALNTDFQDLRRCKAPTKVLLGRETNKGRGAGGRPERGAACAEETKKEIAEKLEGSHLVIITAGMGGGTGTGAAPIVARIAKDMGCLTVAIVTSPFKYEKRRVQYAREGIDKLKENVDSYILIPNDRIIPLVKNGTGYAAAIRLSDSVLCQGVNAISSILIGEGNINLDFMDLESVLKDKGAIYMGVGTAKGENAVKTAFRMSIANPLVDEEITGGEFALLSAHSENDNIDFMEFNEVMDELSSMIDENADVFHGSYDEENLGDEIVVVTIVSGLKGAKRGMSESYEKAVAQPKEEVVVEVVEEIVEINPQPLPQKRGLQLGDTAEVPVVKTAMTQEQATEAKQTQKEDLPPITHTKSLNIPTFW